MSILKTLPVDSLVCAAEMRSIEQQAIETGAATGLALMEAAGRAVVQAVFAQWPELAMGPHRARILCGPGNNGGDGFVIARLLADWGWRVELRFWGQCDRLPPDARHAHDRWAMMGAVLPVDGQGAGPVDLVVDALFGIGISRPLPPAVLAAIDPLELGDARVVAVDIPSGLCADSGRVLGVAAARADLTVTFHRAKRGHVLAAGPAHCGALVVADIGLRASADGVAVIGPPPRAWIDKGAGQGAGGHKYRHGHALILSGAMGKSGAARLAARAALRIGAGLVTVAAPGAAMLENACQLTAIMVRRADGAGDLAKLLAEDARLGALCLGPGLGVGQGTRDLVAAALAAGGRAVVLDADALSAFADDPAGLFAQIHPHTVLTPHDGEFARLFPDLAVRLMGPVAAGPAYSRIAATADAAARAGCIVVLKGHDTVVASPKGLVAVHAAMGARAVPWLATAGAGDVLAGMITGLMARGHHPWAASTAAIWLHAEAARRFGPGLIAEDLAETLPQVMGALRA